MTSRLGLTHVAGPREAPTLVLIPGGPGLSSNTLRRLDPLREKFSLAYVDFPGAGGIPYDEDHTFEQLSEGLIAELKQLDGKLHVLGHSFGGFFAAKAALACPGVRSVICLSTPFSKPSIDSAVERYEAARSSSLRQTEETWEKTPSDQSLATWLSEYGSLYFQSHSMAEGRELLLHDRCSHRFFLHNQRDMRRMEPLLESLSHWRGSKLFLSESNGLISPATLQNDAVRGGFEFEIIPDSSHFLMFDQPERVARRIESFIATHEKGK